jgi:hypothetical protein
MLIHDFKYQFGAVGPPECPNPRLRLDFTGQWMRNVNAAGSFAQFRNQGVLFTRDVSFFVFRLHPEIEQLRNEPGIGDWNSAAS